VKSQNDDPFPLVSISRFDEGVPPPRPTGDFTLSPLTFRYDNGFPGTELRIPSQPTFLIPPLLSLQRRPLFASCHV